MTTDLETLKRQTNMLALLESYGIALTKRGHEFDALCIWHTETNPSMQIFERDGIQRVHCKSCGNGGTVIDVVMQLECCDEGAAIRKLQANGFNHDDNRIQATIPIEPKMNEWQYRAAPDDKPRMTHREYGAPVMVWRYNNAEGQCIGYVARYATPEGGKSYRPYTFGAYSKNVKAEWEPKSWTNGEKPIYGLDRLAQRPEAKVAILEGEKTADAAGKLLGAMVCVSWPGGARAILGVDWSPLAGRDVLLIPDADEPGIEAMKILAKMLCKIGCKVRFLTPTDRPPKWDLADALAEGWTPMQVVEWATPRIQPYIPPIEPIPEPDPIAPEDMSEYELPPLPEHMQSDDDPPLAERPSTWQKDFSKGGEWSPPQDIFEEIRAPIVQLDMVPECMREWMQDTADIKGVDPSILALSSIVACAALLHDSIQVQPEINNPSWRESARLWGAIVGGSASGKTPAINAATSRLKKIQIELSAQAERLEDEYKAQEMAFDLQRKTYIKKLSEADPTAVKPVKPSLPEISRLLIQDVTVDKLADLLKTSNRGCLVDKPELSGWFGSMDAYKNGSGGSDRAAWLTFFDGGPLYVDRIGRGSLFVPNFGGSIIGAIQPDSFARIIDKLPEDGLLQRFLIVNSRLQVEGSEKPYNKAANDRFHNMQQGLFDTLVHPGNITLCDEANQIRKEITSRAFELMRINFVSSAMCSHLGKYQSIAARLMLIFHAIECVDNRIHPQSCQISGDTARLTQRFLMDFLFPHAVAFYINLAGASEVGKHLRKLAELCLCAESGEISNRDFQHQHIGWRTTKPYEQEVVIQQLIDNGWILPAPNARLNARGFPTRFIINPAVHKLHNERRQNELDRRKISGDTIQLIKCGMRKGNDKK